MRIKAPATLTNGQGWTALEALPRASAVGRQPASECARGDRQQTVAPPMPPLRVLLADYPPTRAGIRMALDAEICAEASDAAEAIRSAKREQPDVCLVARHLCGDGLRAVQAISRAAPHAAVVVLAEHENADDFLDAIRAGAIGYVPGPLDGERLRRVIGTITRNEAVVPGSMVLELILEIRGSRGGLTARESQISGLLRRGHTTKEIARRLGISSITVRRHISEVVHKLGLEDRSALTGASPWRGRGPAT
jgi:NarL family two-component system response regulator LiaR